MLVYAALACARTALAASKSAAFVLDSSLAAICSSSFVTAFAMRSFNGPKTALVCSTAVCYPT